MMNFSKVGVPNFCYICREPNRVSTKVSELRNINQRLLRVMQMSKSELSKISSRDIENELTPNIRRSLSFLKNNVVTVKPKCNLVCPKMNNSLLRDSFMEVFNTYERLIYILLNTTNENEFKRIKMESLRLFQGYLPKFYTVLEREIKFNSKENI